MFACCSLYAWFDAVVERRISVTVERSNVRTRLSGGDGNSFCHLTRFRRHWRAAFASTFTLFTSLVVIVCCVDKQCALCALTAQESRGKSVSGGKNYSRFLEASFASVAAGCIQGFSQTVVISCFALTALEESRKRCGHSWGTEQNQQASLHECSGCRCGSHRTSSDSQSLSLHLVWPSRGAVLSANFGPVTLWLGGTGDLVPNYGACIRLPSFQDFKQ